MWHQRGKLGRQVVKAVSERKNESKNEAIEIIKSFFESKFAEREDRKIHYLKESIRQYRNQEICPRLSE